jgi:hypothetical protein
MSQWPLPVVCYGVSTALVCMHTTNNHQLLMVMCLTFVIMTMCELQNRLLFQYCIDITIIVIALATCNLSKLQLNPR